MFNKYTDKDRNNGGSQSEKSYFEINNNIFKMYGYHIYEYNKYNENPIIINNYKQIKQLEYINQIEFNENSTLLDLGCANGAISISLLFNKNFNNIVLLDHDKEYIENIEKLIEFDTKLENKITTINTEFGKYNEPHDYVLALSLIHWLYSATANYGCLFKIIEEIKKLTNIALIIEWIDNLDNVFTILHHIDFNKEIHKTPYNKENFFRALNENFNKINYLGKTTDTRELYICYI